jgi:hypothetical protein
LVLRRLQVAAETRILDTLDKSGDSAEGVARHYITFGPRRACFYLTCSAGFLNIYEELQQGRQPVTAIEVFQEGK